MTGFLSSQVPPPATLTEALDRLDVETARRIHAEEALHESEERFRQFSHRAGKFLWISDALTEELIYVSPGYEEVWSRTRETRCPSHQDWRKRFNGVRVPIGPENSETYSVAGSDGGVRWIRDRMFPLRDSSGQITRMLGISEDITDARQAQEALNSLQQKCRALLTALPDLMFRIHRDGTVAEFHPGAETYTGLDATAIAGKTLKQLLPANLQTTAAQHLARALHNRGVETFTCQYLLTEEVRDFEVRAVASGDDEVIAVARDITDRKRLEREILEVSQREQQRIGQDLHDSLGQHLTGITFLAKVLERKLAAKLPEEAKEADEIGRLVMQALAQTRNLARGLFPVEVERSGLVNAITELAGSVERMCKVRCQFEAQPGVNVEDNVLATHVFRIAQEAINNAVKHAKPAHIHVKLQSSGDQAVLTVTDDGSGFSPEAKMDGLGLKIMHYRARRIGGTLSVEPVKGGGTRVTCAFRNRYESN